MCYAEEAVRLNDQVRRLQLDISRVRGERDRLAQQLEKTQKTLELCRRELGRMRGF